MGVLDRIQQNAARSAAARQSGASRPQRGAGKGRSSSRRVPPPPLDARERRIGYLIALAALVAFVAIWVPHLGQAVPKKGIRPIEDLGIGALMAALIAWSTLLKRRWLLALVTFYVGFAGPWGAYRYVGYVLMAAGAWFLYTNAKLQAGAQRAAVAADAKSSGASRGASGAGRTSRSTPTSGAARTGVRAATGRAAAAGRAAGSAGGGAGGRASKRAAKEPKLDGTGRPIPSPSKRYTPPQPPSKGDRRERRERRESVRSAGANRSSAPKV